MNVYEGCGTAVTVNGQALDPCLDVVNHSPTGFAWGYGGSGPSQLALAIMVHEFGRDLSKHPQHYQDFKWAFVARFPDTFTLTSTEILSWVSRYDPTEGDNAD